MCSCVRMCVCQEGEKEEWEVGEMMEEKLERDFENKKMREGWEWKKKERWYFIYQLIKSTRKWVTNILIE